MIKPEPVNIPEPGVSTEAVGIDSEYLNWNCGFIAVPTPDKCFTPILAVIATDAETAIGILNNPSSSILKPAALDEKEPVV